MFWFDPAKLEVASQRLELVRLDDCRLETDFLKIDVQGLEYQVLAGGIQTIRRCRPVVIAEAVDAGSKAHLLLESLAYSLMEFDGHAFSHVLGPAKQLNQFLIPVERLAGLKEVAPVR
jgi:hypothetical protein